MKRRIIALFMASVMAMSMVACGSKADDNAKEAEALLAEIEELKAENAELKAEEKVEDTATEEVENVEEVAEEEVAEEEPTDPTALYGTKKAINVKIEGEKLPQGFPYNAHEIEGTIEYLDYGYSIKFVDGAFDRLSYFDGDGNLYKYIQYLYDKSAPDGVMDYASIGVGMGPMAVRMYDAEIKLGAENVEYDDTGRPLKLLAYNDETVLAEYTYDDAGRVISYYESKWGKLSEYEYVEDKVILTNYRVTEDYYNSETRETEELHKDLEARYTGYYENGKIAKIVYDSSSKDNVWETNISYNEYGYVSQLSGEYNCTFEYEYE